MIFCIVIAMMVVAGFVLFIYVPHGSFISKNDYKKVKAEED